MRQPILTLTTDFGLQDHYVGTMKGVILGICPQARIVDITHEVAPYGIAEGAYTIAQAYPYFPPDTIHVVVVDPGVGSERRPILVEAAGQLFVAPDNGVLSLVCSQEQHRVRLISNDELFRKPVSRTFHGRDIFAPVAAQLAAGTTPAQAGNMIPDMVRADFDQPLQIGKDRWTGRILKVDRFGNIVTNFQAAAFPDLEQRPFTLIVGETAVRTLARNYCERAHGELFVIAGSSGYLEISLNQESAAKRLDRKAGAAVELTIDGSTG